MPSPPLLPSRPKKKKAKQNVPAWQSWEKDALDRKFLAIRIVLIALSLVIVVALAFVAHRIYSQRQTTAEIMPRVVHSRPPELLQPFTCDLREGFHSGGVQTFVRNVGNAVASRVIETLAMRIVPERQEGAAPFDQIPRGDCRYKSLAKPIADTLAAGREAGQLLPPPTVPMPPILNGEMAQLYEATCLYYSDSSGTEHASCDTYRFRLASGESAFMCDNTPKKGTFDASPVASCGN